ncbi:uncharacterized protein LOC116603374 isoform X1 [Nematostella vectensis]|nr:uncharacterized protein LOC116603374 isoform X1 [Nematostella vectensis]XP_048580105.1 uncharacterized protein LOC116603374 isoform X1 [Nematostella vectensis]
MWAHWKDLFLNVLDRHAPVQSKRKKAFNVPWLTREIKDLINNRDKLKRKAMVSKLRNDWDDFKASRNKVNIALRQAKSNYYRNKIANQKNNPKEAWKTINSLLGRTKENTTVNELKFDDQSLFSQEHIAEAFNDYFSNVGPKLASSMANPSKSFEHFIKPCSAQMSRFKLVSNTKVLKLLGCLSNAKATGIDKISGKILKCAAHAISPSLTYIFNNSIISNCFPDEWKMARVLPLFKKGSKTIPDNYRPISILPVISKLMEKIMYEQLYDHFTANQILSEQQFGFRRLHSTVSALLDSTNSWYINMDRQKFNLVVFLDLKKAFDTVNHDILLRKLELNGITGNALLLIQSYLSNRKQKCQLNSTVSSESKITCGIPQGSILGPLFFLLYINDLPECLLHTTPRLFADDTNLTASGSTVGEVELAMNSDLEQVKEWLLANKLSLNVAKTEFLLIGSHHKLRTLPCKPSISIDNKELKQVQQSRVLGVEIDEHLNWDQHIDSLAKKVSSGIGAMKRISEFANQNTLVSIYNAIIQPHLNYCSEVWDTLGQCNTIRLQKLQNRAARVITNRSNDTPATEALAELGWQNLETQRAKTKAKQMFKVLHDMAPNCLTDLFSLKKNITNYNLRGSSTSLQLPLPKTEFMKKSFSYDGAKLWNSLPEASRDCTSLSSFVRELEAHTFI